MNRVMIDATHTDLEDPTAWPKIRSLAPGNGVAFYDTGSPDIAASPGDIAAVPRGLFIAMIDQGFTGSPNLKATIRDCEQGAWTLNRAVDRTGWDVPRPTLYLGFPDTAIEAFNAGWRGDVWLVDPSNIPPPEPPPVPVGLNVVAVQWRYTGTWDESVVFDPYWPLVKPDPPPTVKVKAPVLVHLTDNPAVYYYYGSGMFHVTSEANEAQFVSAGAKSITVTPDQFALMPGAPTNP